MKFSELGLNEQLLEALGYMGFEEATPIQEQAIPVIIEGRDMIGCAQTGTGKTAAFVLPILHQLSVHPSETTSTLIIVPTRELAIQIDQQIQGLSYFLNVSSLAIYGGGDAKDWQVQKEAMKKGVNIIVATPGKLLSHLKIGNGNFSNLKQLVLDEADRMLDMGFVDDLKTIFKYLPKERQNLLFSATMAPEIRQFARTLLKKPFEVNLALSKPAEGVKQLVYLCYDEQKLPLIREVLNEKKDYQRILLFSSTKSKVNEIVRYLKRNKFEVGGISSDLEQEEREEVLRGFQSGRIPVLVATDVMSRGIDIKEIDMVINFDFPRDAEDYVHRVGRTARANTEGEAISLVNPKDMRKLDEIQKLIDSKVPTAPLPESIGEGPKWEVKTIKKRNYKNRRKTNKPRNNRHKSKKPTNTKK